jgi:hypothetical protein
MNPFDFEYAPGKRIRIGYRTPQLSAELDATGKVALAAELGMPVIEPGQGRKELLGLDEARTLFVP